MTQYGASHRGKRITVETTQDFRTGDVTARVSIDGQPCPDLRGNPFHSVANAQATGAAFARASIDAELDGDVVAYRGYFIRLNSIEQRVGSWLGSYQLHRNDNPVPFRRVTCDGFEANTQVEAEAYALSVAQQAMEADIAAGRL